MKYFFSILLLTVWAVLSAQDNLFIHLVDDDTGEALEFAAVQYADTSIVVYTDSNGSASLPIRKNGEYTLVITQTGYYRKKVKVVFPLAGNSTLQISLQQFEEELDEVEIVSTRNNKRSDELPTRVEVISEEEVGEKMSDKPSDVSHIMREQTGVQVQRTSSTSGTFNIRLQGLRGKYVQVLKNGLPIFGGLSNVIGLTQIPPSDVRHIEIIKGPASTLYGGDAIGGVINLITKQPTEVPVYDLLINAESARAVDAGTFMSQKVKWFGFSLTGLYRYQREVDWNKDDFSETPLLQRYYVSPQLFFDITQKVKLNLGATYTRENRMGGAMAYLQNKLDTVFNYFEKNNTAQLATNFTLEADWDDKGKLTAKNAINYFSRNLELTNHRFAGVQLSSFTELNYHFARKKHDVVVGVDFRTDKFTGTADSSVYSLNYTYLTTGLFAQYIYRVTSKTTMEGGVRLDYNNQHRFFALPHVGFLQKWNSIFSTRLNFSMGYKLPTIFQDETEEVRFVGMRGIADSVKPELSFGGTADLQVRIPTQVGLVVTVQQMYFLTHLLNPLRPQLLADDSCDACSQLNYISGKGYQQTKGIETAIRLSYRGFGFGVSYALTDNNLRLNGVRSLAPLTSKHIVSLLADYTIKNFTIGVDAYYYSAVKLSDGTVGHGIWEMGIVSQYSHKYFLLFANLENLFNIRQSSYGALVVPNPTFERPAFKEVYAPLEGRLFNAGIKIRLGALSKKHTAANTDTERLKGKTAD
ncbi:MAG: TonB-dependent receptor plug domain-containing protein [Chitinophagales bacterium]|nr:TonB-dependent receptor plug domain-containing protein [Chitinophagales bacterium]